MDRRTLIVAGAGLGGLALLRPGPALSAAVAGPEFVGVFAGLGPGGVLIELERQTPRAQQRMKGFGFGGAEAYYELTGAASPVRFQAAAVPPFVVRVASQDIDPMDIVQFFKLQVVRNTRRLVAYKVKPMGVGGGATGDEVSVPFIVKKHGSTFFKVTAKGPLAPGEYGVSLKTAQAGFLFGVD